MARTMVMRVAGAIAMGMAGLVAVPVFAAPASEVELHIEATGSIPPDRVTATAYVKGIGMNRAEAEAALAAKRARLIAEATKAGAAREQIQIGNSEGPSPEMSASAAACDAAMAAADAAGSAGGKRAKKRRPVMDDMGCKGEGDGQVTVGSDVSIELDDPVKLAALQAALGSEMISFGGRLRYRMSDPVAATTKARAAAIAKARAEGEAYAEAFGYRIVRTVRVSNAKPVFNVPDMMQLMGSVEGRMAESLMAGTTVAAVAIDFVMIPK